MKIPIYEVEPGKCYMCEVFNKPIYGKSVNELVEYFNTVAQLQPDVFKDQTWEVIDGKQVSYNR